MSPYGPFSTPEYQTFATPNEEGRTLVGTFQLDSATERDTGQIDLTYIESRKAKGKGYSRDIYNIIAGIARDCGGLGGLCKNYTEISPVLRFAKSTALYEGESDQRSALLGLADSI